VVAAAGLSLPLTRPFPALTTFLGFATMLPLPCGAEAERRVRDQLPGVGINQLRY